jgi:hypothetical protein
MPNVERQVSADCNGRYFQPCDCGNRKRVFSDTVAGRVKLLICKTVAHHRSMAQFQFKGEIVIPNRATITWQPVPLDTPIRLVISGQVSTRPPDLSNNSHNCLAPCSHRLISSGIRCPSRWRAASGCAARWTPRRPPPSCLAAPGLATGPSRRPARAQMAPNWAGVGRLTSSWAAGNGPLGSPLKL